MNNELSVLEIREEYMKIENKWLLLHFKTSVALVIFSFIIECILGRILYEMGEISISMQKYIIKYLILPFVINMVFIAVGSCFVYSLRLRQQIKIYAVSLFFVGICFVLFSVHSIFDSLYIIFTVPILFTVVYGNYYLTTIIMLCSAAAKVFSELCVKWDPEKADIWDSNLGISNFIISMFILFGFYIVCMVVIYFEKEKSEASIQKEMERYQLQFRVQRDELTALNNRTALRNEFQRMEVDVAENRYIFVMSDIDNFKIINDTMGHDVGDLFLIEFGNLLKENCKEAIPFRFGGDEFCVLFKNQEIQAVVEICKSVQEELRKMLMSKEINLPLTVSFGIAKYTRDISTNELLKNADAALYKSKKAKNTIHIYND